MPGFADMLTTQQIKEIVSYERYCLDDQTSFLEPVPVCDTSAPYYRQPATTTTAAKG